MPRNATITLKVEDLAPLTVAVIQEPFIPTILSITPLDYNVINSSGSVIFSVTSNVTWSASSNQNWCTVPQYGKGNETIVATFSENSSFSPRVAKITLTTLGISGITATITQGTMSVGEKAVCAFHIFPNPTAGLFTISFCEGQVFDCNIEIRNILGQSIFQRNCLHGKEYQIDISDQPEGAYYIRLENNKQIQMKKLILYK